MSRNKYYYAIVHRETGTLLLTGIHLPIYYLKRIAEEIARHWTDYIVQKVDAQELERLILKHPNPKAI